MIMAGGVIGGISSLFGIGGATMAVPWLSRCGASLTQAVGTSAACGVPIALLGAATFIWMGWGHPQLPGWTTGYVMWPAFISIVMTSVPFARVGSDWRIVCRVICCAGPLLPCWPPWGSSFY